MPIPAKPTVSGDNNAWGGKLNTYLDSLTPKTDGKIVKNVGGTLVEVAIDDEIDASATVAANTASVTALTPATTGALVSKSSTGTIVQVPAGTTGQAPHANSDGNLAYINLVVLHAEDFKCKADGLVDNAPLIANAIAYGKALGNAGNLAQGCIIAFGPGAYSIRSPIILPRNGTTPNNVVQLVGTGRRSTALIGHISLFPANRALIEWEATATRVWHNRISGMRLHVPNIAGTKAIWHQPVNPLSSYTNVSGEFFQCDLEDLLVTGNNQYHTVFIDLGIGNRWARIVNVYGDPAVGSATYDTILLRTPTDYTGGGVGQNDAMGIGYCTVENLVQTLTTGGYGAAFSGRTYGSSWNVSFAPGGRTQPPYEFINSFGGTYQNFGNEGRSEPAQIRIVAGVGMDFRQVNVGTPNPAYSGWVANHAYAVGAQVVQTGLISGSGATSSKLWQATVAGTSGATQPAWTNTLGDTITDGTVTWQAVGEAVGVGISLESGTRDCSFTGRIAGNGNPKFSSFLSKAVKISSDSARNVFERFQIRANGDGNPTTEFQIDAPAANLNHISGTDLGSGTTAVPYAIGNHPLRPSATATLTFGAIAAQTCTPQTITVPGAKVGDVVELGPPAALEAGLSATGIVTATDTVTVRLCNVTSGSITPVPATWRASTRRGSA